MRKDMFKVIVERPRRGARFRINRARLKDVDALPKRIGMKRFRKLNRTESKWLNENLAPLKRYLMKQTGRPWNKVYSEVCENLDANHTVKQHVRDHLGDFVVTKVSVGRYGELIRGDTQNGFHQVQVAPWHQPLYVDPNDGILKHSDKLWKKLRLKPKSWRRAKPAPDPNIVKLDDNIELHCIERIWYEVKFGKRLHAKPTDFTYDKLTHHPVWPGERHAMSKEQLSAKAIAALKLPVHA